MKLRYKIAFILVTYALFYKIAYSIGRKDQLSTDSAQFKQQESQIAELTLDNANQKSLISDLEFEQQEIWDVIDSASKSCKKEIYHLVYEAQ